MNRLLYVSLAVSFLACSSDSTNDAGLADAPDAPDALNDAEFQDAPGDAPDTNGDADPQPRVAFRLSNFRIDAAQPSRVYFDSTQPIVSASEQGFLSDGVVYTSLSIADDGQTGHYLVTESPFTYWDNHTIRYESGAITSSTGEELAPFGLRHIVNHLDAPAAERGQLYVDASVASSGDGSTPAQAFRTLREALASVPRGGGFHIWVKAGLYQEGSIAPPRSGQADQPNIIEGYRQTPGDITYNYYEYAPGENVPLDATRMPVFDGEDRGANTFCDLANTSFTIWRNLQVTNFNVGFRSATIRGFVVERFVMKDIGALSATNSAGLAFRLESAPAASTQQRLLDGVVVNATSEGVRVSGNHSLISNVEVYCNEALGGRQDVQSTTDYYITIRGNHNIIRDSLVYKDTPNGDGHLGHGFSLKASGVSTEYNLITDCRAIGIFGSFQARHPLVAHNVFRNSEAHANIPNRRTGGGYGGSGGIELFSGGRNNTFENLYLHDLDWGINIAENSEIADQITQSGSIVRNCIFERVEVAMRMSNADNEPTRAEGLRVSHNIFVESDFLFRAFDAEALFAVDDSMFRNNIFVAIGARVDPDYETPAPWTLEGNVFHDVSFEVGAQDRLEDPRFENAGAGDYHLQNTNLRQAGVSAPEAPVDRAGVTRPAPATPGVFEFFDE